MSQPNTLKPVWESITRTALLGTARLQSTSLVQTDTGLAQIFAQLEARNPEDALLAQAGIVATMISAGTPLQQTGETPLVPAAEETLPECSPNAADALDAVLRDNHVQSLAWWLSHARRAAVRCPYRMLPALLDRGRADKSIRADVITAGGARANWLAGQHTDWAWASAGEAAVDAADADEQIWQTGALLERVRVLAQRRKAAPASARATLEAVWAQAKADEREAFIATLADGLSLEDETFLNRALADRAKGVRMEAARLLSRIEHSAYAQRMWERVVPLLKLVQTSDDPAKAPVSFAKRLLGKVSSALTASKDTRTIEVQLLEACDKPMQADGIELKPQPGTGERQWWLRQMLALVAPSRWLAQLGLNAESFLLIAARSLHADLLLAAMTEATITHQDTVMATALVESGQSRSDLLALLPAAALEQRVIMELSNSDDNDLGTALQLAQPLPLPWSTALSQKMLAAMLKMLSLRANTEQSKGVAAHNVYLLRMHVEQLTWRLARAELRQLYDHLQRMQNEENAVVEMRSATMDRIALRIRIDAAFYGASQSPNGVLSLSGK